MRKILAVGAVIALVVAVAWPAMAADFRFTGIYRTRGISYDNVDKNDDTHDGSQYYTALFRPRFTATSEGGKVVGFWEPDVLFDNSRIWDGQARWDTKTNRFYIDFAIPYTKLRMRTGRHDYTEVGTSHLVAGSALNRKSGHWIYGPLFGGLQVSAWTVKRGEGQTEAADTDLHYIALSYNVAPKVTVTGQYARFNQWPTQLAKFTAPGSPTIHRNYWGGNIRAAAGIFSGEFTFWVIDGDRDFSTTTRDLDEEAFAADIRLAATLGNLKLDVFALWSTGDDNPNDSKAELFQPVGPWSGRNGPIFFLGATGINPFGLAGRNAGGGGSVSTAGGVSGSQWGNGLNVYSGTVTYNFTKKHLGYLRGSWIQASQERIDTTGGPFRTDKDIGFELDAYFQYKPYPSLTLKSQIAYLFAGDYGETATAENDDSWLIAGEIRYDF